MNKKLLVLILFSCVMMAEAGLHANSPPSWPVSFYKGWERSLRGGGFGYHSPEPGVTTSLLVRSDDSTQFIEWETEALPAVLPEGGITSFVWIFGIDANPSGHKYKLFVNGTFCLEFANPVLSEKTTLSFKGLNGSTLSFRTTMIDKYGDLMGYAFLTLPASMVKPAQRQTLKVCGESAGSRSWYMTFESGVAEKISLEQQQSVIRSKDKTEHFSVNVSFVRLGEACAAVISNKGNADMKVALMPGYNSFRLLFPTAETERQETVRISVDHAAAIEHKITLKPVRPWKIYLVQHTHTDIGYTRPQTEILPEHLRYIDYALDYCDQTDSLPDAARFRWTCETSWAVNEYLKTRPPSQIERLKKRAAEGRIEIAGLYLNSSDLGDEVTVAASLQPVGYFRSLGFKVKAAMQDDINGVPWCLVDYLSGAGISYLNMGQNTDRALKPFGRPTTFWWESPSGSRIIVNRPEHYMWGDNMGVITGVEAVEKELFRHLSDIAGKGYPFNEYAMQFSGYFTDNSPPSTKACKVVKEWNETYVWPELRLATISEFLDEVKSKHAEELPVYRGAWPDWWIDGFGSAALTTAYTRMAHTDFIANNGLMAMNRIFGGNEGSHVDGLHRQVFEDIAFYDEHTFGAAESITDPDCENSVVQLGEKLAYTWDAVKKNRILREEVMGSMQDKFPSDPSKTMLTLVNTLSWGRSGNAELYIDHQLLPADRQFRILDASGKVLKTQVWSGRAEGAYYTLFAENLPPFGYRSYRIELSPEAVKPAPDGKFSGMLENNWYRLKIDPATGKITSLYDKESSRELADPGAKYGFGEFIYETLGKNREQISKGYLNDFKRNTWGQISFSGMSEGDVWTSVTLTGQLQGCATADGIKCEIRLYKCEKKIEFRYSMKKLPVTDPEGVYISFPFAMDKEASVFYEVAGGTVEAGKEQLDGSATDWQGIQNFVFLKDREFGVTFVSPEIPIVQLGDINLGKFSPTVKKPLPVIYSWVLNNYWTTNFLAKQDGELKWTYVITSGKDIGRDAASRFAWGCRVPVLNRVLPATGKGNKAPAELALMGSIPANLLLVNAMPWGSNGVVFQLRETAGTGARLDPRALINGKMTSAVRNPEKIKAFRVNVLGENLNGLGEEMQVKAFETVFIKLAWDE